MTERAHGVEREGQGGEPGRDALLVVGLFATPQALLDAIPKVKEGHPGSLEACTPYPVHGLDRALGLRRSPLGGMVMVMGALGALAALLFQGWMNAVDYPTVTGGKPVFSWEAFIPVLFEVMVLFATFTAGLGMLLLLNRLPFFSHPLLRSRAMAAITRDRFALVLEGGTGPDAAPLDAAKARALLEAAGATDIEVVEALEARPVFDAAFLQRVLGGIAAACLVAGLATWAAVKAFPVLPPMRNMLEQPRLNAQSPSPFFKDGSGMRPPAPGTVARGHLPPAARTPEEAAALPNPLAPTFQVLERGRRAYRVQCLVCHGALGNGVPTLSAAYGAKPANLQSRELREGPDGRIYGAILLGRNAMPSYASDLSEEERWAVVHYVRALQRAQNASDEDLQAAEAGRRGGRP